MLDSRIRCKLPSPRAERESVSSSLRESSVAAASNPAWSPVWKATAIRVKASILRIRAVSDATSGGGISWGSLQAPSLPLGPTINRQSEAEVASANFSSRRATSAAAFLHRVQPFLVALLRRGDVGELVELGVAGEFREARELAGRIQADGRAQWTEGAEDDALVGQGVGVEREGEPGTHGTQFPRQARSTADLLDTLRGGHEERLDSTSGKDRDPVRGGQVHGPGRRRQGDHGLGGADGCMDGKRGRQGQD
jgi:hypothetical protein